MSPKAFSLPIFTALISVLSSSLVQAQTSRLSEAYIHSSIEFLRDEQTTGQEGYDPGQWKSQVKSQVPEPIGVGHFNVPYEEPTAFVAGSVANVLAEIYMIEPRLALIPPMIEKTKAGFSTYRAGPVFHFYPPKMYKETRVRGPRFMYLAPQWWGFTNTPPDADTTSVANLTLAYSQAIQAGTSVEKAGYKISNQTVAPFVEARDLNRNAHIYNATNFVENSGAYLTWLYDEKNPEMPRNYFAAPDKGARIPFNKNDVDCVVNANVIKMLTVTQRTQTPGYRETCQYLNQRVARQDFFSCGMYYPSSHALPYAMATAMNMGAKCLEPSRAPLIQSILDQQARNGSWKNNWKARVDYVQSTAWALNTLLILGNPKDPAQLKAVQRGIGFLMSQARQNDKGQIYWQGEVFYAAIFIVRFPVVWRSTAYTTATVAKALVLASRKWNVR